MVIDSAELENDEFGYSCYTIVAPAPPELTKPLLDIEIAAGQTRANIPAHVTVKGTLYAVTSLEGMIDEIHVVTARRSDDSHCSTGEASVSRRPLQGAHEHRGTRSEPMARRLLKIFSTISISALNSRSVL